MDQFRETLLEVWREACQHIEIRQSAQAITRLLLRRMPIGQLWVYRLDQGRSCLAAVAHGIAEGEDLVPMGTTPLAGETLQRLLSLSVDPEIVHAPQGGLLPSPWREAVGVPVDEDTLVGPLSSPDGAAGVLVLVARSGEHFDASHTAMARALLSPFTAALENDHRVQEMEHLRQAAEADRQSLLTKLGRREIADALIGADGGLRPVMERIERVAKSDVPVLFLGESGTGKELMARAIHARSSRRDGPIIRVNCGAIPPDLIDSQLFGHEKGAFTGAVGVHKGWFERADGGTLFLDEIGELPHAAQVRLLRILQDGWLERIGGGEPIKTDVRVVAATHQDLADMVAKGAFREDLWYRLAVFPILLPPLRQRHQDMPQLARHFAERAAVRFGLPPVMPSQDDIALLCAYDWPGNVRELASVIDRAAILGDGHRLEVRMALGIGASPRTRRAETSAPAMESRSAFPSLDEAMRAHIREALRLTQGRVEGPHGAAVLLCINPHTLRARMRKLGIDWKACRERPAS